MAKPPAKLRSLMEYTGMLFGYALFACLPFALGKVVAYGMADIWRLVDRRHRLLAVRHAMERLGMDRKAAEKLARDNYRHYALLLLEVCKLRSMPLEEVRRRTDMNGCDDIMMATLSKGKGLIVLTGHLGNWEWGSVVLGMAQAVSGAIARPLNNPGIDGFLNGIRSRTGVVVWNKFSCMRRALATIRQGNGFVAVVDQDGGHRGTMIPFLGRPGSTMTEPVDLAVRTGAPIFVGAVIRSGGPGRFRLESGRVFWPRTGADPVEERNRLLTEVNADLSEIVRRHPEQWLWIHNRWKTAESRIVAAKKSRASFRRPTAPAAIPYQSPIRPIRPLIRDAAPGAEDMAGMGERRGIADPAVAGGGVGLVR